MLYLYIKVVALIKAPKCNWSKMAALGGRNEDLSTFWLNWFAHWSVDEDGSVFSSLLSCITALLSCHAHRDARRQQKLRLSNAPSLLIMVQRQLRSPLEDECGLHQKKGKITRAGFKKRTGCTIICSACCWPPECLAVWAVLHMFY